MRPLRAALCCLPLASAICLAAGAQPPRELRGQVFHRRANGTKVPEAGVIVSIPETGNSSETNDLGVFRLPVSPVFRSGDSLTLAVEKRGWSVYRPVDGRLELPRELPKALVQIELLPASSPLFLTADRILSLVGSLLVGDSVWGHRPGVAPRLDLDAELDARARCHGLPPDALRRAIARWAASPRKPDESAHVRGLKSFAAQDFDGAARQFAAAAQQAIAQMKQPGPHTGKPSTTSARLAAGIASDLRLEGNSYFYAYRFEAALDAYRQALRYAARDSEPALWIEIQTDIGAALTALGSVGASAGSPGHFAEAIAALHQALALAAERQRPLQLALIQTNLGNVLTNQAWRTEGERSRALLSDAIAAYDRALAIRTRDELPRQWARTENDLGLALWSQGERTLGAEGDRLLAAAVEAFHQSLSVRTRSRFPDDWAMTQDNLGDALQDQARRTGGSEAYRLLTDAVSSHEQALEVLSPERSSQDWAIAENNLCMALEVQARLSTGESLLLLLARAVRACNEALRVLAPEREPQLWALAQTSLGNALFQQGRRATGDRGSSLLAAAADAYRKALSVRSQAELPLDWATTEFNLGLVVLEQGKRAEGADAERLLDDAAQHFKAALLVRTRELLPQDWAATQTTLATALRELGARSRGDRARLFLAEAVARYREAMLVRTREALPQGWAATQISLGNALVEQAKQTPGKRGIELLAEAAAALREASTIFTRDRFPQEWAILENALGAALLEQGVRAGPPQQHDLLVEALAAQRQALLVFTPQAMPNYWQLVRTDEARVLLALARDQEAELALAEVVAMSPDERPPAMLLLTVLKDRLFDHARALRVVRDWSARHAGDHEARALYAEQLFANDAFEECGRELASLLADTRLEAASARIPLLAYAVAVGIVRPSPGVDVAARMAELRSAVAALPPDTAISWTFTGTIHRLEEEPALPGRAWLLRLFRALATPDRQALLKSLGELQAPPAPRGPGAPQERRKTGAAPPPERTPTARHLMACATCDTCSGTRCPPVDRR